MSGPARLRPWRALALAAGLLLALPARAAVPVVLPAGEDPAAWQDALGLAGMTVGPPGAGASVELVVRAGAWLLRVKDASGRLQEVSVAPPHTAQEREDVLWLAQSLLHPLSGGSTWADVGAAPGRAPPAPPVPSASPTAAPAPSAVTTPPRSAAASPPAAPAASAISGAPPRSAPVASVQTPPPPAGGAVAPPASAPGPGAPAVPPPGTTPSSTPPPATTTAPAPTAAAPTAAAPTAAAPVPTPSGAAHPTRPAPWGLLGVGVGWRADAALAPGVRGAGGIAIGRHLRLGLGADWMPERGLTDLGPGRHVGAVDLMGGLGWTFTERLAPTATVTGGVSIRSYLQDELELLVAPVPLVGMVVSLEVPLAGPLLLSPFVAANADLRGTDVLLGDTDAGTLSPFEVRGGLTICIRTKND
jgi:hypothetical protein